METRKIPVVSYGLFRLFPDVFDRVELRRIRRQEMEFNEIFFAFQPLADLRSFVICNIVRDQMDFVPS